MNKQHSIPPAGYFATSASFRYLGPAFAVILFSYIGVLGVVWFRIASATLIFALWKNPWVSFLNYTSKQKFLIIFLGFVLACMNTSFYLAINYLPLAMVAAIEFLGPIIIAFIGMKSLRNFIALSITIIGVTLITNIQLKINPLGLFFSFLNCFLFMIYISLGHSIAQDGGINGVERIGVAMTFAFIFIFPIGILQAASAFSSIFLVIAGFGVGICSSVIPYAMDQLAMSKLNRSTFALMLSLLPMFATIIGIVVLAQFPTMDEILGIILIVFGLALHHEFSELN